MNTNVELDLNNKTHLSSKYYRVSDSQYFKEILHSDTTLERLNSHTEIIFTDPDTHTSASALTNSEQVVNDGIAEYTKDYEFSLSRTINTETKMPAKIDLVTTKFGHKKTPVSSPLIKFWWQKKLTISKIDISDTLGQF